MSLPVHAPTTYADFQGLESLKAGARAQDSGTLREAARQFESLFTHMMLKSMREAGAVEGVDDSEGMKFYQDMFDQQLSMQLSKGDGLGLASRLIRQLSQASPGPSVTNQVAQAGSVAAAQPGGASDAQQAQFVRDFRPLAEQAAAALGVDTGTVIAQAALETGWGRSVPSDAAGNGYNYFGLKAGAGAKDGISAPTREFGADGLRTTTASFRTYGSAEAGIRDYAALMGGSTRYAAARGAGADVRAFATALQQGGYATDPDYVQKLVATADSVRRHLNEQ